VIATTTSRRGRAPFERSGAVSNRAPRALARPQPTGGFKRLGAASDVASGTRTSEANCGNCSHAALDGIERRLRDFERAVVSIEAR